MPVEGFLHSERPDQGPAPSGEITTEVAELAAAIGRAIGVDYTTERASTLAADAVLLTELRSRLDALDARVVAAADRSDAWSEGDHANCAAMLRSSHPNRHRGEPYRRVRHAQHVARMPHAAVALENGDITAGSSPVACTPASRADSPSSSTSSSSTRWSSPSTSSAASSNGGRTPPTPLLPRPA